MNRIAALMVVFAAFAAKADVYWFVGGSGASWQDVNSYRIGSRSGSVPASLPGGTDLVMAGSNSSSNPTTVDVSAEDINFVAALKGVSVRNCRLTLDVATNSHFSCAIAGMSDTGGFSRNGTVVKQGAGDMYLDSVNSYVASGRPADYLCDTFAVSNGNVYLLKDTAWSGDFAFFGCLDVAAGSTFYLPPPVLSTGFYFGGISGEGDISTDGIVTNSFYINPTRNSVFGGRIRGNAKPIIRCDSNKTQTFSGDASDTDQRFLIATLSGFKDSTLGFSTDIGYNPATSPLGAGILLEANGGYAPRLKWTGTGTGNFRKTIYCYSRDALVIDGGDHGGLNMEGSGYIWRRSSATSDPGVGRIVFTGDGKATNAVNCKIFNKMSDATVMSQPLTIVKQGAGTWLFKSISGAREIDGAVGIDEGVLQIASLAPVGEPCCIGYATHPYDPDYSVASKTIDATKQVPWHVRLGGGTTAGTLEYVGTAAVTNDTRVIAVYGEGTLKNSSAEDLVWRGVVTAKEGESRLTLDSPEGSGRLVVSDVTNTIGTLSVAKTGAGEAILDGDLSFNGTLSVDEGRLVAGNPSNDTYFRFTIKDNHGGLMGTTYTKQIRLSEFALYSADGARRNVGLAAASVSRASDLEEGQVAYLAGYDIYRNYDETYGGRANGLANAFDETNTIGAPDLNGDWYCYTPGEKAFDKENDATYVVIVMRLPANTPEIVAMDYVSSYSGPSAKGGTVPTGGWYAVEPRTYTLESSPDGVNWHEVYSEADTYANHVTKGGYWISSDGTEQFAAGAVRKVSDGKGLAFTSPAVTAHSCQQAFANVTGVKVAAGATLSLVGDVAPIRGFTVDAATGVGSLRGATFAETGTLNVIGTAPSGTVDIAIDWSGVANPSALAGRGWSLMIDGSERRNRTVRVTESGISVCPLGFIVTFK